MSELDFEQENKELKASLDRLVDRILAEDAAHAAVLDINRTLTDRLIETIRKQANEIQKRDATILYLKAQLEPQHPCALETDEPAEDKPIWEGEG